MYRYFLDVHSLKGKGALQVAYINCLELIQFSEESSEGTADCGHMVLAMTTAETQNCVHALREQSKHSVLHFGRT